MRQWKLIELNETIILFNEIKLIKKNVVSNNRYISYRPIQSTPELYKKVFLKLEN